MNILILDDHLNYVTWMEDFILFHCHTAKIKFVDRFDRAIIAIEKEKPDIIVTDIGIGKCILPPNRKTNEVDYRQLDAYPEINIEWGGVKFIHHIRNIKKWPKKECEIITFTGEIAFDLVQAVEKLDAIYGCKSWMNGFKDDLRKLIVDLNFKNNSVI